MALTVIAASAHTPVGFNLRANVASVRAGINGFVRAPYLRTRQRGEPITVSMIERLEHAGIGDRMIAIGRHVLTELCLALTLPPSTRIAALLSLPEERPAFSPETAKFVSQQVLNHSPLPLTKEYSSFQQAGNAGGAVMFLQAEQLLQAGFVDVCLVGGIESHIDIATLHWIEDSGRLRSKDEPNGLIPGEGAAFVAVCAPQFAAQLQLAALFEVTDAAIAQEPFPWFTRKPTLGQGLTTALKTVLVARSAVPEQRASSVYCDLNGESWRADEWSYAYLRTAHHHASPVNIIHPANSWGDVGAASIPLLVAVSGTQLTKDAERGQTIAIWAASGTLPLRGAVTVTKC